MSADLTRLHEAREAYLRELERLLRDDLGEGRAELDHVREQLAQLDVTGTRRL